MVDGQFRRWVQEIWFQHCEECENWLHQRPSYDIKEYFNKYKYWLKREYRHRQAKEK